MAFRAVVAYTFRDRKTGKVVYSNRVGPFEQHILLAVIAKVLSMPNTKDLRRKGWKNDTIIVTNPENGHEFQWTPRGWAETKLPKLLSEKKSSQEEEIRKLRRLWDEQFPHDKIFKAPKFVIKLDGKEIKAPGAIEVRVEHNSKKE